jgi:hypothetical protein
MMISIYYIFLSRIDANSPRFELLIEVEATMAARSILPVTCEASPDQIMGVDGSDLYPPHPPSIHYLRDKDRIV